VVLSPVMRDSATATFFDGTRDRALLLRRRRSAGDYLDPGIEPAPSEEADLEYVPASGRARVVSWATLYSAGGDTDEPVRTVLGIVELDEGLWWWSQLVDVDPDTDLEGLPVQVDFVPSGPDPEDEVVPVFRPVGPEQLS
jgi:uncharacterized OB-fold protein